MSDPMFAGLAVRLTEDHFTSVHPDAPRAGARSPYPRRRPAPARCEHLRTVARWVEPAPRRSCQPG